MSRPKASWCRLNEGAYRVAAKGSKSSATNGTRSTRLSTATTRSSVIASSMATRVSSTWKAQLAGGQRRPAGPRCPRQAEHPESAFGVDAGDVHAFPLRIIADGREGGGPGDLDLAGEVRR